jgi:hypothetical protein
MTEGSKIENRAGEQFSLILAQIALRPDCSKIELARAGVSAYLEYFRGELFLPEKIEIIFGACLFPVQNK